MDEVGAQVASPIFIHQALAGRLCEGHPMAKKRGMPHFQHYQEQQQRLFQAQNDNWNPKAWNWDSARFIAKPLESEALHLGVLKSAQSGEQRKGDQEPGAAPMMLEKNSVEEDDESLRLKLGGGLSPVEEPVARANKRVRSGSPAGGSYPMCQVDNCKEDLSSAKDYHRRHKVCEVHSKSSKALVGKQMQRFCQQCSRFHLLSEFDEGKRSCRRRLAGHNRRRRKTQPEDVTSRLLLPANVGNTSGSANLDIVNLLTVLARAQGSNSEKIVNCPSVPNQDQLIEILSKINSLPLPADLAEKLQTSGGLSRNIPEKLSSDTQHRLNEEGSRPSTKDLLAVLSAESAESAPDAPTILSQRSSQSSETEKTKLACLDQDRCLNLQKGPTLEFTSNGGERSSTSYQSPAEDSDCQVLETRSNLPLQLFSSSPEDSRPPKQASTRKYFSSGSSNPMDERSPSSSPTIMQKLFPMRTSRETWKSGKMSISGEVNANVEALRTNGSIMSLDLFGGSKRGSSNSTFQSFPSQAGYTSSSGSDHSPSSLNSDAQDRTGRIIFKLFDKDPSQLPGTLRTEIYNWLSHSPSEMESHIRPGCVVLSIYISMSFAAWEKLEENLLQHVNSLVQDSESDFWRSGRFLVQTGRQLVSHKDGRIRLCKLWRTGTIPELMSVFPLAVVGGQVTSLSLRGRNLSTPGTKIHCTDMGGYVSKEASSLALLENVYEETCLGSFKISGDAFNVLGRCFIEVENGFSGTCFFPVIIADASICQELRLLESEFDDNAKLNDTISEDQVGLPRSREEVLHFLNELGWLFQRKRNRSTLEVPEFKLTRIKYLFIFSVERDCCQLVKTLLDILLEINVDGKGLSDEPLGMLSEIHLLNRAVKRRCRKMVELLLHYSVINSKETTKKFIFPPNLVGPGDITPLHLAACMSNAEDLVDSLTSDPQEIGLHCWNSCNDVNGLSPYAYALMRNNNSYNRLVARKTADRKNDQISILIGNGTEQQCITTDQDDRPSSLKPGKRSCSKCAVVAARYNRRFAVSQGLLQRPYVHSILAIAAVCVCVCLFLRGSPDIGLVAPFKWENLNYGPS